MDFNLLDSIRKYSPETLVHIHLPTRSTEISIINFNEHTTRFTCEEYPNGFDETLPLNFHSPYGCSKGGADQYLLDA